MVSVASTGGGGDALRGVVPSAPLLRRDEEPMDVDTPQEAEPRPLPFVRLFGGTGGHCPSSDSSGAVVPTLLRRCRNRGNKQLLSRSARRVPTSRRQRRLLSGGLGGGGGARGGGKAAAWAGNVRARCLFFCTAGTREMTPRSSNRSCVMYRGDTSVPET